MTMRETDLAAPVVAFLAGQGYAVKSEVGACDLVAVRDGEPPVVVELKRRFSLDLLLQGVDRLAMTDAVYLAFPADSAGDAWKRRRSDEHTSELPSLMRISYAVF